MTDTHAHSDNVAPEGAAATMIRLAGVDKTFESPAESVPVLEGVDLSVDAGELLCLLGESGSGKTTILNIISGLEDASGGSIDVLGTDVVTATESERSRMRLTQVGLVFQDHNLIHEFTALENVMLPLVSRGIATDEARGMGVEALTRMGVEELEDRLPAKMSGGQRQRVGIARALAGGQNVLLCDEPTGALDHENSRALFELLRSLVDGGDVCVILCTHDLNALDHATRTLRLRDRRLAPMEAPSA